MQIEAVTLPARIAVVTVRIEIVIKSAGDTEPGAVTSMEVRRASSSKMECARIESVDVSTTDVNAADVRSATTEMSDATRMHSAAATEMHSAAAAEMHSTAATEMHSTAAAAMAATPTASASERIRGD
jgi:hypothetical protein